ncbi:MAG: hypothetical protein ABI412_08490, partial [Sphingomicrobium sp.]
MSRTAIFLLAAASPLPLIAQTTPSPTTPNQSQTTVPTIVDPMTGDDEEPIVINGGRARGSV